MHPAPSPNIRNTPFRFGAYTALITALALGALSLGLGTWSGWQWHRHFSRMLPLLDSLNSARDAVSEGYVWVEAHLREESPAGEDTITEAFDRAVAAVGTALATRDTAGPGDPLSHRLQTYQDAIGRTARLAQERAREHTLNETARNLDLQLFTALHGLNLMAKAIDVAVQQEWRTIMIDQRILHRWAMGGWIIVVGIVSAALLVAGHRRARAEDELALAHRVLEERVEERTAKLQTALSSLSLEVSQRREAQRALSRSEADLRALSAQLITVQEEELTRLARELHDGITQDLGAIKFRVEHVSTRVQSGDADGAAEACEEVVGLLQKALEEIRTTYMALRPSHLDDLGLSAALTWLCRKFQERHPEIQVNTDIQPEEHTLSDELKVTVFRIVQEALDNVGKHSGATRVRVSLGAKPEGLSVVVEDDGAGFVLPDTDGKNAFLGVGLRTMRERARSTGGALELNSAPGHGTRVAVHWRPDQVPPEPEPG
ncbi:MAG: sensor histidine kinase [Deferrisomatales bacterium]|nr:sensor histidine kinase [Deferrisomatales bacterium]